MADRVSMKTYSLDLRQRVLAAYDRGKLTQEEVAERFEVSRRWLCTLLRRRREGGSVAALPHGGGRRPKFAGQGQEALRAFVVADPDTTLQELLDRESGAFDGAPDRLNRRVGIDRHDPDSPLGIAIRAYWHTPPGYGACTRPAPTSVAGWLRLFAAPVFGRPASDGSGDNPLSKRRPTTVGAMED